MEFEAIIATPFRGGIWRKVRYRKKLRTIKIERTSYILIESEWFKRRKLRVDLKDRREEMVIHRAIEFATPSHEFLHWVRHLGGPGLIILGLIDSSVIPIPGSMDAATILLSAHTKNLWPYFALMATIGSVTGGYLTYHIARRQGKNAMEKRISKRRINQVTKAFEKWGFGAVLVPAILPPPAPMVPFLIAAGAMQYSRNRFLVALAIGRAIRFTILGLLGALYGRWILTMITNHAEFILIAFISASVVFALYLLFHYRKSFHAKKGSKSAAKEKKIAAHTAS